MECLSFQIVNAPHKRQEASPFAMEFAHLLSQAERSMAKLPLQGATHKLQRWQTKISCQFVGVCLAI
jgi:hypothetical protein